MQAHLDPYAAPFTSLAQAFSWLASHGAAHLASLPTVRDGASADVGSMLPPAEAASAVAAGDTHRLCKILACIQALCPSNLAAPADVGMPHGGVREVDTRLTTTAYDTSAAWATRESRGESTRAAGRVVWREHSTDMLFMWIDDIKAGRVVRFRDSDAAMYGATAGGASAYGSVGGHASAASPMYASQAYQSHPSGSSTALALVDSPPRSPAAIAAALLAAQDGGAHIAHGLGARSEGRMKVVPRAGGPPRRRAQHGGKKWDATTSLARRRSGRAGKRGASGPTKHRDKRARTGRPEQVRGCRG